MKKVNEEYGTKFIKRLHHVQKLFPKVTKVLDATEPISVEVRARDNRRGAVKDPGNCAMARACKRELQLDGVIISLSKAYLVKGDTATRYNVPASLSKEVISFDRYHEFEPGIYSLSPIWNSEKWGNKTREDRPHTGTGERRGPIRVRHQTTGVRKFYDRSATE